MKVFKTFLPRLIVSAITLNAVGQGTIQPHTSDQPNIIIMISVDMLSQQIIDRYAGNLPGGLGRILKEGVVFQNSYQEHAHTETCPGHSTLLSGRHPTSTGIGTNSWWDPATGKSIYCVSDDNARNFGEPSGQVGSSDRWFRGTTFGTWLKDRRPGSRVFSVSAKDRAAIMMAGPKTDGVYWFQEGYGISSSTAYMKELPPWVSTYNKQLMTRLRSQTLEWSAVGAADGLTYPGEWKADLTGYPIVSHLPRVVQSPGFPDEPKSGFLLGESQDGTFWSRFRASPYSDEVTFDAAEEIIKNEHLGEGKSTDLLCIGLSATNATEHAFGDSGPEVQDVIRRLDLGLGKLLDGLHAKGKQVVVVLSADHGGLDFAERLRSQGIPARRIDTAAWSKELRQRVQKEFGTDKELLKSGEGGIYVDHQVAASFGKFDDVVSRIEKIVSAMPEVADVASFTELKALPERSFVDPRDESVRYRMKFSAPEGRTADILYAFKPLVEKDGPPTRDPAQHGTPWDYDRRVPIIFWGPWKAEHRLDPISTIDIAPTLASEFHIEPEEKLDGRVLNLSKKVNLKK